MHDNNTMQLGLLHKENKKLKKKNKRLNREIINLRFKLLMKRPRMTLISKMNRRISLDVVAEVSEHMQKGGRTHSFGKLHEDMQ